ncbi:hypothetical protein H6P81_016453 [Aristolochia fimbriata]|uniref:Uncharacterized protein n=1 Tax=Aristolochia fimbriata TaxID=158543 RepID=A0AAV7ECY2_ARIFI|nr:hypothetical protein H6P81_016453 [Aristolochia fimbriata]
MIVPRVGHLWRAALRNRIRGEPTATADLSEKGLRTREERTPNLVRSVRKGEGKLHFEDCRFGFEIWEIHKRESVLASSFYGCPNIRGSAFPRSVLNLIAFSRTPRVLAGIDLDR